jgi:hypothetical protein
MFREILDVISLQMIENIHITSIKVNFSYTHVVCSKYVTNNKIVLRTSHAQDSLYVAACRLLFYRRAETCNLISFSLLYEDCFH